MLNKPVFPNKRRLTVVACSDSTDCGEESAVPGIPVLSRTRLLLHLEAQERSVDLRRVSELILGDLGATLQVLRLAGSEYSDPEGPGRLEDCICDLGFQRCLDAMPVETVTDPGRRAAMADLWNHSKTVAEFSQLIAKGMSGVCPERAYLAGLLHGIGWLPEIFAWRGFEESDETGSATALSIASRLVLPGFVMEILRDEPEGEDASRMFDIVQLAHLATIKPPSDKTLEMSPAYWYPGTARSTSFVRWN